MHQTRERSTARRVRQACEWCRVRKVKVSSYLGPKLCHHVANHSSIQCNAKFPCHKCTESGLFCQEAARLKPRVRRPSDRYRTYQSALMMGWLMQGWNRYLQTLETNRLFLTETVQQLYAMIRSCTPWVLGEPGLDEYGRPILHDIAQCLGLLRPDNRATPTPTDTSSLPEDEMHATTLLPVTTDVTITFSDANVSITPVERKLYSFLPDMASPLIESMSGTCSLTFSRLATCLLDAQVKKTTPK